jgi:hypothetical protein
MSVQLTYMGKVYDNYMIDKNGIIYDMNGNIQEYKLSKGRYKFKGKHVHAFMIHSFLRI